MGHDLAPELWESFAGAASLAATGSIASAGDAQQDHRSGGSSSRGRIAHARNKCLPPVVKHLRRGCLNVSRAEDGRIYRRKITSLAFKGEHDPVGVPASWTVGEPVERAVQVLERGR